MAINILEPKVFNRISAGEVVEKPASIVKELIENSIDAGAKHIRIEIEEGGIKNIIVSDDGSGIEKDDLTVAFLPHATSKIKNVDDLDNIVSLGFRGEALASISSVCQVKLSSKTRNNEFGYSIKVNGGVFENVEEIARENGTTLTCSNLFFNTPVRAKFLRKPKTEEAEITHLIEKFMLAHSDISFTYYIDGKQIYNTLACDEKEIIYTIYGKDVYDNLLVVNEESDNYKLTGYVTKPKICKSNRTCQTLFVNGRNVENYLISNAVQSVFESFLMKGKFPIYVLSLTLPTDCVDVNVHPSKREVKFDNTNKIYGLVRSAIEKALMQDNQIREIAFDDNESSGNIFQQSFDNQKHNNNLFVSDPRFGMDKSDVKSSMSKDEGKSFLIDEFDNKEQFVQPKEFDIEVKNEENNFVEDLKNTSLSSNFVSTSPNNNSFFFNQSGNMYAEEIKNETQIQQDKFLNASVYDEMKILGTLFNTYIVIELDESVYFIDQHAGHERILYDKLVNNVDSCTSKQDLLLPYTFKAGALESSNLDLILNQLHEIGFEIVKNEDSYTVKTVPYILSHIDLESFVDEILKENNMWNTKPSDFIHGKLCQSACKHAIKGGDKLSRGDCAYIIKEVRKGVMLCPHGRPITLVITKHEFEKMFKRIV